MERARKGILIAVEGIDGTGKSTQVGRLADYLRKKGCRVIETREPTCGPYGQKIRQLFIDRRQCSPEEELELFVEDRRQHVRDVIAPALDEGNIVVTDRYYFSTAAYQGAAGHEPDYVFAKNNFAPEPDLVILLIQDPKASLARIKELRGEELNEFEQEDQLHRVAALFASFNNACITRIDADAPMERVELEIRRAVDALLQDKKYKCEPV